MASKTSIEWTESTWNPIRARNRETGKIGWFCEHATPGCEHCYSEALNRRLGTRIDFKRQNRDQVEIFLDEKILYEPLRWTGSRRIFVCSMTDWMADFVEDTWISEILRVVEACPQHTFQTLTKRAARQRQYFGGLALPFENLWLGVSVEDQPRADERIPLLLDTPATVRWISAEPLLGPVDLISKVYDYGNGLFGDALKWHHLPYQEPRTYPKLEWVVVGSESGPGARPCDLDWVRGIRDQCTSAGVAFFWKQDAVRGRKISTPALDGRRWVEYPTQERA